LAAPVILALFALADGLYARQTYADYWVTPIPWYIYDRELQHAEWFFRPDRRDFARWLTAQDQPLLVPIDELNKVTTRAWLISAYPEVITAGDDYQPPAGTRLVAPWSLELGDLYRDTRHYAVLDDGKIILMPPLSVSAHTDLLAGIDAAQALTRETGSIDLLARTVPLSESAELVFEAITLTASQEAGLARFGNDEVVLLDWRGPNTVDATGERILAYTLDWTPATERIGHEYNTFLQIQTQDHEWITGDDAGILRWLFPSSIWQRDDVISDVHVLALPDILEPGAYRLVTGMYIQVNRPVPAYSTVGSVVNNGATIGWIKVPQSGTPVAGEEAISIDANLADTFNLHRAAVGEMGDGTVRIRLYWESTIERPEIDATIFVHILNAEGALVAQSDIRPWNGQYPTFIWSRGEIVQTDHSLIIGDTELAGLQVSVGMYTFPDIVPLKVIQNGQESDEGRVVLGSLDALLRSGTNRAD
jgi:hypothetical protein